AAYSNRCGVYNDTHEYDRAILDCDQAIALDQKNAYSYNNRGNAYRAKGQVDRALAEYTKAIELNPKNIVTYKNRGNAYEIKPEYERGQDDYRTVLLLPASTAKEKQMHSFAQAALARLARGVPTPPAMVQPPPPTELPSKKADQKFGTGILVTNDAY